MGVVVRVSEGDLAIISKEGDIANCGRVKDLINRGAEHGEDGGDGELGGSAKEQHQGEATPGRDASTRGEEDAESRQASAASPADTPDHQQERPAQEATLAESRREPHPAARMDRGGE